ncbi:amino acid permease/ SLC12A domain-containing protein, partial [Blyttiomyces helicus]
GEPTRRRLKARHLQMIAIGGTIGTGLFLSSGMSIAKAGPAGALLAYIIAGIMVFFVVSSLGEMATFMPISGSFNAYATRFVDPALGFTAGWTYWFQWALTLPAELTAAGVIIQFWLPNINGWVWFLVLLVILFGVNIIGVEIYGEVEFVMSFIKVIAVIIFIILGVLIDAGATGNPTIGFSNYNTAGGALRGSQILPHFAPFANGFSGIFQVFTIAFFSYGGTELVGITAGEAADPRKSVPKAINGTFWRISIFYTGAIFIIGLLLPSQSPELVNPDGTAASSPFTLSLKLAGINAGANVINAVILVAVVSAANSSMYAASRTLMALALEGKAPSIFGRTTKNGVPLNALIVSTFVGSLAFLGTPWGNGVVFFWLTNLISCSILVTWLMILWTHIRFRQAYVAQGLQLDRLPFKATWYPWGAYLGLAIGII